MSQIQQKVATAGGGDSKWLELVVQQVKSLRYGVNFRARHRLTSDRAPRKAA